MKKQVVVPEQDSGLFFDANFNQVSREVFQEIVNNPALAVRDQKFVDWLKNRSEPVD